MFVTKIHLQNWRNFRSADADLSDVTYVLGPNASGKSNFLDVFRFLRDIAKSSGGGLQKAVRDRGSLKKLRCLHARTKTDVGIAVEISENFGDQNPIWKYELEFNAEGQGHRRALIKREVVTRFDSKGNPRSVLSRPDEQDKDDPERLTQTAIEQIQANANFRGLADFFGRVTYVHLVPQLLKFADQIGGRKLEDDPFGQGFMERVAEVSEKTRKSRLTKIEKALKRIIPQLESLNFVRDDVTNLRHLEARFKHHRPHGAIQREDQFSDGTLRLISLFWLLLDGTSLLLLEEPELSLNEEVVRQLPYLIDRVQKSSKKKRQVIITTHSAALLSNLGIDGASLLILTPSNEGTSVATPTEDELTAIESGFSAAEVVLPKAQRNASQMELLL